MPLVILIVLLIDLLSVGALIADIYLWREWWLYRDTLYDDYARRCLYGAIGLLAYASLGRFLFPMLVSKRSRDDGVPEMFETSRRDVLKRPDGSTLLIEYYGNEKGQPIIFVHGWNANSKEWWYQKKFFEKDYRVILINLPGLGGSKRPKNKDFSLAKMARDLNNVIDYTGAKNPVLWGHSIGGMVILTLLAKHRESLIEPVKGIILQHTTYTNPVKTILFSRVLRLLQKPVIVPLCHIMIVLSPFFWINRWLSFSNGTAHLVTRALNFTGAQSVRQLNFITLLSMMAPPAVTARGVLAMLHYDVTNDLGCIHVPALILAANKDRLTQPAASQFMHERIRGSELVVLSPGGHQALVERQKETNEAAANFIRRVVSKTAPKAMHPESRG